MKPTKLKIITALLVGISLIPVVAMGRKAEAQNIQFAQLNQMQRARERVQQIQEQNQARNELLNSIKEGRQKVRQVLQERARIRVRSFCARLVDRLKAVITRLERLGNRIEQRISIIKSSGEGADVEKAEDLLADARAELDEAELSLEEAKAHFENMISSEEPREVFSLSRESVREVISHLKNVHATLVKAITLIKGLRVGVQSPSLSPSPEASATP